MLTTEAFKFVIQNTPLISIDICLVCNDKLLMGRRKNEPLKNEWFTPGGRVFKNETWQDCLKRVAKCEIGFVVQDAGDFRLMGVWDHFYKNSAMDGTISTHYVNLPHYCHLKKQPVLKMDDQHDNLSWFDLQEITTNNGFNEYMHKYASWLISRDIRND